MSYAVVFFFRILLNKVVEIYLYATTQLSMYLNENANLIFRTNGNVLGSHTNAIVLVMHLYMHLK